MRDKLKLNDGETLVQESYRSKGTLAETDIYTYSIINAQGEKIGAVVYVGHTSIKGFHRTQTVEQRDIAGSLIGDLGW